MSLPRWSQKWKREENDAGSVLRGEEGMTNMLTNLVISSVLWLALHGCAPSSKSLVQSPVTAPATQPSTPAANEPIALPEPAAPAVDEPIAPPIDPAIDALLTKLEASVGDLTSFTATIGYDKE